jgi:tRNA A37 threonylcarbamoyladenosine dehydratase
MSPSKKPTVSLVAPCFNEAEVIGLFHSELTRVIDAIDEFDFKSVMSTMAAKMALLVR